MHSRLIKIIDKYQNVLKRISQNALMTISSMKFFFDFVVNDRLRRMSHRESRWEKILRWIEYFATQMFLYHESMNRFVLNSKKTTQVLWTNCWILLQMSDMLFHQVKKKSDDVNWVLKMLMLWRKSLMFSLKWTLLCRSFCENAIESFSSNMTRRRTN